MQCGLASESATCASKTWHFEEFLPHRLSLRRMICGSHLCFFFFPDGPLNVPPLVENILDNTPVPNFKVFWAGAALLLCNLGLLVPVVDDELVMVHKSLEGVW